MRQKRKLYGLRIGRAQQKGRAGYDKRGLPSVSDQQLVEGQLVRAPAPSHTQAGEGCKRDSGP
jgi:hypothetical protein